LADPVESLTELRTASLAVTGIEKFLKARVGAPPAQLAQTQTGTHGRFALNAGGKGGDLYIVANGGRAVANATGGENSAIALMAVLGGTPPHNVVVNEMTTIASVFTYN
jgi:hypothetical protein